MKTALLIGLILLGGCSLDGPTSRCEVSAEKCDHCKLECGHEGTKSGAVVVPPPV